MCHSRQNQEGYSVKNRSVHEWHILRKWTLIKRVPIEQRGRKTNCACNKDKFGENSFFFSRAYYIPENRNTYPTKCVYRTKWCRILYDIACATVVGVKSKRNKGKNYSVNEPPANSNVL